MFIPLQHLIHRAETHIIDLDEDLLGKEIRVYLLRRLRDEKKFSSLDELRAQLEKDKALLD